MQSVSNGHTLVYDDTDNAHRYILDGQTVFGVSDILKAYPLGKGILAWNVEHGAESILAQYKANPSGPKTKKEAKEWIEEAKRAPEIALNKTADIGHIVHDYAHAIRLGHTPSYDITDHPAKALLRKRFKEIDEWSIVRDTEETIVAAEEIVASPTHKFGGKYDVLVRRKSTGKLRLEDYKSSRSFHAKQFIQQGGYAQAIYEWNGLAIEEVEIVRITDKSPKGMVISSVDVFIEQFLRCKYTREFQRTWEPVFKPIYYKKK